MTPPALEEERCPFCGVRLITPYWALYDKNKTLAGKYCCRECAFLDTYGPRSNSYSIRKKLR